ncbi:hypothetical protein ACHAPA_010490 [Fusarium lateritium]
MPTTRSGSGVINKSIPGIIYTRLINNKPASTARMAEKPDKVDPLRRGRELASYYACHQEKDPGFLTKADISWVKEYCDCQDAEDGHPDKWDTNKASATATRSWWRKEMEKLDKAKGTEGVPPTAATAVVVAVPASLPVSDHGLQHIVPVPSLNTPAIASLPNDDTQRVSPASQSQTLPATSPVPVPVINQTHQRPPVSPIPTSSTSLPRSSHIRRSVFSSPEPSDIGRVSVPELKRLFDGWNGESTTEQLRPSNTSHPHPAREKVSETVPFGPVLYQYYLDKRRGVLPPKTSLAEQVLERIETTEVIGNDVFAAKITGGKARGSPGREQRDGERAGQSQRFSPSHELRETNRRGKYRQQSLYMDEEDEYSGRTEKTHDGNTRYDGNEGRGKVKPLRRHREEDDDEYRGRTHNRHRRPRHDSNGQDEDHSPGRHQDDEGSHGKRKPRHRREPEAPQQHHWRQGTDKSSRRDQKGHGRRD